MTDIIVIEALDGVGKTTTAKALNEALTAKGFKTLLAREPGFTPVGEKIRDDLLLGQTDMTSISLFYLFLATRMEMLNAFEKEHKDKDYIVLDRFWPSTLAYQVYGDSVPLELFNVTQVEVERASARIGREIDICLTLPEAIRQERLTLRNKAMDRFESRPADFIKRVEIAYDHMTRTGMLRSVDANASVAIVVRRIMDILEH